MAVDYDARYRKGYAYGKEPNEFVRVIASTLLPPATRPLEVLSLGEGQGRNVVHLAALGHQCTAVDLSAVGLAKTEALASERHVGSRVTTIHADLCHYDPLGGAAEDDPDDLAAYGGGGGGAGKKGKAKAKAKR
jgi:SAM-dependent methyltransferase